MVKSHEGNGSLFLDCHPPQYFQSTPSFITEKTMKQPYSIFWKKEVTSTPLSHYHPFWKPWNWPGTGKPRHRKRWRLGSQMVTGPEEALGLLTLSQSPCAAAVRLSTLWSQERGGWCCRPGREDSEQELWEVIKNLERKPRNKGWGLLFLQGN